MPHAVKMSPNEFSRGGYDEEFHSSESEEIKRG